MRSGAIAATARLTQIGLQLSSAVILARLLTPRDFGIQAMVVPLTILFNSIVNTGLQTVVIQREDLRPPDATAMFWLGLKVNLVFAGLMAASGAVLSRVYHTPEVVPVSLVWAAVIYLAATSAVHEALLKRQLRFGTVWSAHLAATVVSIGASLAAALGGAGHWALMIQIAVMELGRSVIVWTISGWRPSFTVSHDLPAVPVMRDHWLRIGGFRVLSAAGQQLDRIVAGAVGGPAALGLYETAKRWAWLPFLDLFLSLSDVAVSTLSRVQHDAIRYRRYLEFGLLGILTVSVPAITFIFIEARSILLTLLGERWLGAEPFLRLMAVAAIAASFNRPMQWLYVSRGESARQLRWTFVSTPVLAAGVLLGSRHGTLGVGIGFTISMGLLAIPSIWYALRGSPVTVGDLAHAIGRPLVAAVAAGTALVAARAAWGGAECGVVTLVWTLTVFAVGYLIAWVSLPGGLGAARELLAAVREIRAKSEGTRP